MFKSHNWQNKGQQTHLKSARRDAAGNIVEADDGITDIKHTTTLRDGRSLTTVVHTRHYCMQHSLLNLQTTAKYNFDAADTSHTGVSYSAMK